MYRPIPVPAIAQVVSKRKASSAQQQMPAKQQPARKRSFLQEFLALIVPRKRTAKLTSEGHRAAYGEPIREKR